MTNNNTPTFSNLMTSFGGRNAVLIMTGTLSMAEAFDKVYGEDTENNGWCGRTLSRYPSQEEAEELGGEYFTSSWGWEFPDGSCLYLTPGGVSNTVSVSW